MAKQQRAGQVPDHLRSKISLAVSPWDWLNKARTLRKAANSLFIEFEADQAKYDENYSDDAAIPDGSTVEMLLGFAVENLLKGLYVTTVLSFTDIKDLKQLSIPGNRHELSPIAEAIAKPLGLTFSKDELDILNVLEHVILWFGRYPSARNIDDLIPMDETGIFKKFYFNYPNDHYAALRLYDRLEETLEGRAPKPLQKSSLF